MQKRELTEYHNLASLPFENAIITGLKNPKWFSGFFTDQSHGIEHGREVARTARLLIDNLTTKEKKQLTSEGKNLDSRDGFESASGAIRILAFLHDCGRFSETGKLWPSNHQNYHPEIGAARAISFCINSDLLELIPIALDGISNHEYQNPIITPHYKPARTLIARVASSADQLGWFRQEFIERTIAFNLSMGKPFFNPDASTKERASWISNTQAPDALTVILSQVDYPINPERFGTSYSRSLARQYQKPLKQRLVETIQRLEPERAPQILDAMRAYEQAVK